MLDLLGEVRGLRVLDLGCGDGVLTLKLIERGASVVGVDSSEAMVQAAKEKGIEARVADAMNLKVPEGAYDAVFTNAAMHWMPDHPAVMRGAFHALKPGGVFAGELGGHGNVAAIATALRAVFAVRNLEFKSPWTYASMNRFGDQLAGAGFTRIQIQMIPRPTPLPTGMEGWLRTFARAILPMEDEKLSEAMISEAVSLLEGALKDEAGNWFADYIRLRFRAEKPR